MNRLWRGIAIFVLGGLLGTGFGVALGFPAAGRSRATRRVASACAYRACEARNH